MRPKASRITLPLKSRIGMFLSLAVSASLLTPLMPAAFGAGGSPAPAPRAAVPAAAAAFVP